MIEVDQEEKRHLIIVFDGIGIRTVMKVDHQDGVELVKQLTEYYGRLEYGMTGELPKKQGLVERMLKRFIK